MSNESNQRDLLGRYYGYSVCCVNCRPIDSSTSKNPLKIKKCLTCGKDFEPVKISRIHRAIGGDHDFNEDGRGIGFDFKGYNGIIYGIFPPRKFYTMKCKNCSKEFKYEYVLKYKIIDGVKYADMDGSDGHGIPCEYCNWWN